MITVQTIDPRGLMLRPWTAFMTPVLFDLGADYVPILSLDDDWKSWALDVIQDQGISKFNPPDPRAYEDWDRWALAFIGSIH